MRVYHLWQITKSAWIEREKTMATAYVLYNPLAGKTVREEDVRILEVVLPSQCRFYDITRITNYAAFLGGMEEDDYLVIAGGDGTLNRFANATADIAIRQEILYFPIGTGNDFAADLGKEALCEPFPVTKYLQELPSVRVHGKTWRFINGVGFGIDGYCCQVGDEMKKTPGAKVDYASIAIKGLLRHFSARNAVISVDGREYTYQKVWIAPTMHGRYYGGGMMAAPQQDRQGTDGTLSLMLFHGAGRLRTLCAFPGIFNGSHVRHKNMVTVHTGHCITVRFDRPTPLQIDGETIQDVTEYTAMSDLFAAGKAKGK